MSEKSDRWEEQDILILVNNTMELNGDYWVTGITLTPGQGYFIVFCEKLCFLGESIKAAKRTALFGDWFIPVRDGLLTPEVKQYYESRAQSEEDLDLEELPDVVEERRIQNMTLLEIHLTQRRAQRRAQVSEMDSGSPVSDEDLRELTEPHKDQQTEVHILYEVRAGANTPPKGLYLETERKGLNLLGVPLTRSTRAIERVVFKATENGWVMQKTGEIQKVPKRATLIKRAVIVTSEENRHLLNLGLYNEDGQQFLRLVGDEEGNIRLNDIDLTRFP